MSNCVQKTEYDEGILVYGYKIHDNFATKLKDKDHTFLNLEQILVLLLRPNFTSQVG
jgi:hypothetical protein